MLLFSTLLDIKDDMTKEKFVHLVIEWNNGNPHPENVIPGVVFSGNYNELYKTEGLSLQFRDYNEKNIIAARYHKNIRPGVVWTTDYVMNFQTMRLSIRLSRSFTAGAEIIDPSFSTPYFITLLRRKGYLKDDHGLPVSERPVFLTEANMDILKKLVDGNSEYAMPVIYVSKTFFNKNPLDVEKLANRVKGIAHVLVQSSSDSDRVIRTFMPENGEYGGGSGIYFSAPFRKHLSFVFENYNDNLNSLVESVIKHSFSFASEGLNTWEGVTNALAESRMKSYVPSSPEVREKLEEEFFEVFEEDFKKARELTGELTRENAKLTAEVYALREQLNSYSQNAGNGVLKYGKERDLFPGEIREILLSSAEEKLKDTAPDSRRHCVLKDIISSNRYEKKFVRRTEELKKLLHGLTKLSPSVTKKLADMGFEMVASKNHCKFIY